PLAASHLHSQEPCESYAKTQKTDRYAPAFVNSDYDFVPVVFETSGAVNKEGENVLKQIIFEKGGDYAHCVRCSCVGSSLLLCSICRSSANFEPRLCRPDTSRRQSRLTLLID